MTPARLVHVHPLTCSKALEKYVIKMAPNLPTVRRAGLNTSVYGWHKVNPASNTTMSQWNCRLYIFQYLWLIVKACPKIVTIIMLCAILDENTIPVFTHAAVSCWRCLVWSHPWHDQLMEELSILRYTRSIIISTVETNLSQLYLPWVSNILTDTR